METTGLHAGRHAITEMAVVNFDGKNISECFHTLIDPEQRIPLQVVRYNGITERMLAGAPAWPAVMDAIEELTAGRVLVAHNAHFDYTFLREAFLQQGRTFERRVLCTLQWHRRLFPRVASCTLPALCRRYGIDTGTPHRALSDAMAVVHLFRKLSEHDQGWLQHWLNRRRPHLLLPPHLPAEQLHHLPDSPGIYYLLDHRQRILYIGKARNLRQRIWQHFISGSSTRLQTALMTRIAGLQVWPCGSELLALLLEASEIRRHYPPFNKALKRADQAIGLVSYADAKGYLRLALSHVKAGDRPLAAWPAQEDARRDLSRIVEEYHLCPRLAGLQRASAPCSDYAAGRCDGACADALAPATYNLRVLRAVAALDRQLFSGLIITDGRTDQEHGVVAMCRGYCLGFGFVPRHCELTFADVCTYLQPVANRADTLRIIGWFIRQEQGCRLLPDSLPLSGLSD